MEKTNKPHPQEYGKLLNEYIERGIKGELGLHKMKEVFDRSPQLVHDILCKYVLSIQPCNSVMKVDETELCSYRGNQVVFRIGDKYVKSFNRCAVGLFMSDEEYKKGYGFGKKYENTSSNDVIRHIFKNCGVSEYGNYMRLLEVWQKIHDYQLTTTVFLTLLKNMNMITSYHNAFDDIDNRPLQI